MRFRIPILEKETVIIESNMERFDNIFTAVAHGIHHHLYSRIYYGSWRIFSPDLHYRPSLLAGTFDSHTGLRADMERFPVKEIEMPHPRIFRLFVNVEAERYVLFKFVFYEGFEIYAASMPFYKTDRTYRENRAEYAAAKRLLLTALTRGFE